MKTQTGRFYYAKYQLKRSILENALQDDYTVEDYNEAVNFFGGCAFCGALPPQAKRKDHLVAVFKFGDHTKLNVVPACQKCDDSKGQNEYEEWMSKSTSTCSLKARGFTEAQIRQRIRRIKQWHSGYKHPKTMKEFFREDYTTYMKIIKKMDKLCEEAEQMAKRVRAKNGKKSTPSKT